MPNIKIAGYCFKKLLMIMFIQQKQQTNNKQSLFALNLQSLQYTKNVFTMNGISTENMVS